VARFIVKRALNSIIALIGLLVVVFFLARLTGNPASLYLPETATQEELREFTAEAGLDQPVLVQFGRYVWDLLHLDFGTSLRAQRPAMLTVLDAFPTTLILASVAMAISIVLSLVIGSFAAARPTGVFDRVASTLSLLGASAPDFWIAIMAILVFAVSFNLLPTSGSGGIEYWIMPVAVVAIRPVGLMTQVVRGTMISALSAPYVKTARAKGLGRNVILMHALRTSLLPVITVAGDFAVGMINGSIIAETVFGLYGVGKVMIDAILNRDFAVVQSAVLLIALAIFVLNIVIDVLYALVDPRIRHS